MPRALSSDKITQIVRLSTLPHSARKKALLLGVTHPSIAFYEKRMDELGVTHEFFESLSDVDKQTLFHPEVPNRVSNKPPIDYEGYYEKINAPQPRKGKYLLKHAHEVNKRGQSQIK